MAVVVIREKSGEIQRRYCRDSSRRSRRRWNSPRRTTAQALADLWDKARKAKVGSIATLKVRLFDAGATWKVHQAMATLQEANVTCHFEAGIEADGIDEFELKFTAAWTRPTR